jgi:hypothetical protein
MSHAITRKTSQVAHTRSEETCCRTWICQRSFSHEMSFKTGSLLEAYVLAWSKVTQACLWHFCVILRAMWRGFTTACQSCVSAWSRALTPAERDGA